MALQPRRFAVLAAASISLALPAAASADGGGAGLPVPSGGAAPGVVKPPAPTSTGGASSGSKSKGRRHHHTSSSSSKPRFPVAGSYSLGGPGSRFGAPRPGHRHQGQDISAAEGTPVVAPLAGTITYSAYQASGAGIYLVMHASGTNYDFVFMHLKPHSVRVHTGQHVSAGQRIASVGHTGAASGAHLHFEVWVGSWFGGGRPIDPLPLLRVWERWS
jgi:murein DD-endopeptidase MepM/ murein hydrolase activator NlpD